MDVWKGLREGGSLLNDYNQPIPFFPPFKVEASFPLQKEFPVLIENGADSRRVISSFSNGDAPLIEIDILYFINCIEREKDALVFDAMSFH